MLEVIATTEKMQISYDSEKKYCTIKLTHTEDEDLFKKDLLAFLNKVEIYKPKKNLWDLTEFKILIDPELQEWIDENINSKEIELGVTKEAFVMPDSMIIELSVEQTMEENHGAAIETELFKSHDKAIEWLLK